MFSGEPFPQLLKLADHLTYNQGSGLRTRLIFNRVQVRVQKTFASSSSSSSSRFLFFELKFEFGKIFEFKFEFTTLFIIFL